VLNLEADDERARGAGWTPSRALLARLDLEAQRLAHTLARPGDVVLAHRDRNALLEFKSKQSNALEFMGDAWSPTVKARAALRDAGVALPPFVPEAVLEFVSSRRFAQSLSPVDPREIALGRDDLGVVALPEGPARVSLAHTCAGRGHWFSSSRAETETLVRRALAEHPCVFVAARVRVLVDFALHGWVHRHGEVTLGAPTSQRVDPRTGAWRESTLAPRDALSDEEVRALFVHAEEAGAALARAGYWGPFGIDAFRFETAEGRARFCPRCEVNARYTMGWATGMRDARARLE
jgi:hypothetical protein